MLFTKVVVEEPTDLALCRVTVELSPNAKYIFTHNTTQ